MPAEAEVAQPEPKDIQLTQSLEHVFDQAFPSSVENQEETVVIPDLPAPKQRTAQSASVVEAEPEVKPAAKEEPKPTEPTSISDLLLGGKETAKVEAVTEVKDPVKEEAPPEMKGKARENFERLSTAKFEAEKRALTSEKRIKELETKQAEGDPTAKARISQLETELTQYREIVKTAQAELDPEFQRHFTIPLKQVLENTKATFAEAGGDPDAIESALALKGRARAERLDELLDGITSETLRAEIRQGAKQLKDIGVGKDIALKNRDQWLQARQQQEQANKHRAFQEAEAQTKASLVQAESILRDQHGFEVFKTVDDPKFAWWNEQTGKMKETAEQIMLRVSDPNEMAVAAYLAAAAPRYRVLFQQEVAARQKAEKELREYKDSEPSLGGKSRGVSSLTEEEDEKMGIADAILSGLKGRK